MDFSFLTRLMARVNQKPKVFLAIFLLALTTYRLLLSWSGQRYWPDEYRYLHAMHFVDELFKGSLMEGLRWVFGTTFDVAARPGFMFLAAIPAFAQGLGHLLFGIQPSDAAFYRIPAICNVAVSVGVTLLFYRVLYLFAREHVFALLGVIIYGLLVNTNLYVRHLFPYDWSLLLLLGALNIILSQEKGRDTPHRHTVVAGLLTGVGITTYTPYWPMVIILTVAIVASRDGGWRNVPMFIATILSIVIMWEGIARLGGLSYVGRFTEAMVDAFVVTVVDVKGALGGPIFLPFYALRVEGLAGAMLLVLFTYFWVEAIRGQYGRVEVSLMAAATGVYLIYGTIGMFTHNYIFFFGRLIHMYFPFVVLGAVLGLKGIAQDKFRMGIAGVMIVASIVSFVPTAAKALAIRYPRDIERELVTSMVPGSRTCVQVDGADKAERTAVECDLGNATALIVRYLPKNGTAPDAFLATATETRFCNRVRDGEGRIEEPAGDCNVVLENFRHVFPTSLAIVDTVPPTGFMLSAAYDHPLQFDPYWFEDFPPDARNYYAAHPVQMRVYRRTVPISTLPPTAYQSSQDGPS